MLTLRLHFMKNVKNVIKKANNAAILEKHLIFSGAFFIASIDLSY